jgi:hypothetical protein
MSDTTYEDAKRCPKCNEPGLKTSEKSAGRNAAHGTRVHTFECRNNRCKWFNEFWVVQVNPDGTVPPPNTNRQKSFPALPPRSDEDVERSNKLLLQSTLDRAETR